MRADCTLLETKIFTIRFFYPIRVYFIFEEGIEVNFFVD